MKLSEAILELKTVKKNIIRYIGIYNTETIDLEINDDIVANITGLLQHYSELENKILKTNLSYQAEIKNADDEDIKISLQEIYRMIQNNLIILDLFQSNLSNQKESVDKNKKGIIEYQSKSVGLISKLETRINYLKNILLEAEVTVDLVD